MMKTENNQESGNGYGYKNSNQHQEINTVPKTFAGQGCSFCVDMGCGIGVGCSVCQAVQDSKEVVDDQSEVNTGEKPYLINYIKKILNHFPL